MDTIIEDLNNFNFNEIDSTLLNLIENDFNKLSYYYIHNITDFTFEAEPEYEYILTEENSKIIYEYLIKNNRAFMILKEKLVNLSKNNLEIYILDNQIQSYIDYYLEYLL